MVDLKQYVPNIYNEILDMDILISTEEKLFEKVKENINKIKNNQFVLTSDLDGIRIYESMLGIIAPNVENIESRKLNILYYFKNHNILANYEVKINGYNLEIALNNVDYELVKTLDQIIYKSIPANLSYNIKFKNIINIIDNLKVGNNITRYKKVFINTNTNNLVLRDEITIKSIVHKNNKKIIKK